MTSMFRINAAVKKAFGHTPSGIKKDRVRRPRAYYTSTSSAHFEKLSGWIQEAKADKRLRGCTLGLDTISSNPIKAVNQLQKSEDVFVQDFAKGLKAMYTRLVKREFNISADHKEYKEKRNELITKILRAIPE